MALKKKKTYKNYQEYLNSTEWAKLRKGNHDRVKREYNLEELECEVCNHTESDFEMHVHHFLYPSDWNDDKMQYHVVLCKECHERVHNKEDDNYKWLAECLEGSKNRLQFIRNFNEYLKEESHSDLCDMHSNFDDVKHIVKNALLSEHIKIKSEYKKSKYNNEFFWFKSICGVSVIPSIMDEFMNFINGSK